MFASHSILSVCTESLKQNCNKHQNHTLPSNNMSIIKGKRILDLSRIIAGPYASMTLADLGCSVTKIQPPEGDPTRLWGPPWHQNQSAYFMAINRNKKSLVLNLKQPKCRQVLYKLVATHDAVLQNFVPGTTHKLQIDYDTLKKYNHKLVYCSVSGFGDIGSKQNYPAFDNLIQAETGFMHLTGDKNGPPFKLGFAIADVVTSLYAANAILGGFIHQMQTGEGIHIKTSLFECAVASLINQGSNYLNGGMNPSRMGNHHPNIVPYGLYSTKTLPIVICVGTPQQYQSLKEILNLPDMPEYSTNEARVKNRQKFDKILTEKLVNMSLDEVVQKLQKRKVPCGRVNDLESLFKGKTIKELEMVKQAQGGRFVASPLRTYKRIGQVIAPPELNQDCEQILTEIGLNAQEIEQIKVLSK